MRRCNPVWRCKYDAMKYPNLYFGFKVSIYQPNIEFPVDTESVHFRHFNTIFQLTMECMSIIDDSLENKIFDIFIWHSIYIVMVKGTIYNWIISKLFKGERPGFRLSGYRRKYIFWARLVFLLNELKNSIQHLTVSKIPISLLFTFI